MRVLVTLLAQKEISAKDDEVYQAKLDRLVGRLERMGFSVTVEDESEEGEEEEEADF